MPHLYSCSGIPSNGLSRRASLFVAGTAHRAVATGAPKRLVASPTAFVSKGRASTRCSRICGGNPGRSRPARIPRGGWPVPQHHRAGTRVVVRRGRSFFTTGNRAIGSAPSVHRQTGRTFAARFENAIETIARLGYDEVVAIGRDCPALRGLDIERAFAELKSKKLVLGPDHRGGCYLIAFRSADRELLRDVRWKRNTDCAQLLHRAGAAQVFLLPVKHDLDSWSDLPDLRAV